MKEDMGKIQKDNKQGVVCIRCVRVLCRPSSRYRKAGTGLYTKKRDFLLHYSGAKKSRFFFCTTTQGGHAMKKYWKYSKEQLRDVFSTTEQGLSEMQVKKIRETCGENILEEGKRPGLLRVFLSQFADLLIFILLIAALISMLSGNAESTIVIAVVLVMNAVLGTVQHQKAEKSLDSLKNLSAPCAKVIREGKKKEIPSRELVPGDLVELEAGDMVVADGRILDNYSLQVNESALTGESTNVEKTQGSLPEDLPLADRRNMVYSGSLVTYGRAQVLVTGTGMHTEIGKIAGMMNDIRENVHDWSDRDEVKSYLGKMLDGQVFDKKGLIYGMGHAVYSLSDPRERVFRSYVEHLAEAKGRQKDMNLYNMIEEVAPELIAEKRHIFKGVSPNVDFYSGFVYEMLGIPSELYTPLFAIARIAGWSAHRLEELVGCNKIIRPAYKSVMEELE